MPEELAIAHTMNPLTASRIRFYNKLGLRHEETCQSARSRQHRSMIVDKQIDFFWLIVSMGHSLGSQIEPVGRPGPHKAAKSTQQGCQEQADRAIRGQMDPARAPGAARSSQLRPDRASQGGPGRLAGRPADRANPSWPARQLAKLASSTSLVEHFRYG